MSIRAHVQNPRRQKAMQVRMRVEDGVHHFFRSRGFLPVRTPLLVNSPGMEPHIRPFVAKISGGTPESSAGFLHTSPEFAMKRLLVGGLERIYQLCPAFRAEPASVTHHPEFTLLEWYRAHAGYEDIMRDTEELVSELARENFGEPFIPHGGHKISVAAPWPRLRVRDLFRTELGIELVEGGRPANLVPACRKLGLITDASDTWDDLYFKIWLNFIEPRLPSDQAVFVTRYPESQAALAVVDSDPDGSRWARRFEVYAGGLELGNAFEELTDPVEQRRRFEKDMDLRERLYGSSFPRNPMDEDFLRALEEGMPHSGGIAMGVDRLVMLFADEPEISYTFWQLSYPGQNSS